MPYIQINLSRDLSTEQKDHIKRALGEMLSLIPGKVEAGLMVAISGGYTMYMAGQRCDAAHVAVHCFKQTPPEAKRAFTAAVFQILSEVAGLDPGLVYLNFTDHEAWGAGGKLAE
ncbi:MAG: phenylpyruvate tautomerase MIF-related protein [Christensenellales bacterium]